MYLTREQQELGRRTFLNALAGTPARGLLRVAAATNGPVPAGLVRISVTGHGPASAAARRTAVQVSARACMRADEAVQNQARLARVSAAWPA